MQEDQSLRELIDTATSHTPTEEAKRTKRIYYRGGPYEVCVIPKENVNPATDLYPAVRELVDEDLSMTDGTDGFITVQGFDTRAQATSFSKKVKRLKGVEDTETTNTDSDEF